MHSVSSFHPRPGQQPGAARPTDPLSVPRSIGLVWRCAPALGSKRRLPLLQLPGRLSHEVRQLQFDADLHADHVAAHVDPEPVLFDGDVLLELALSENRIRSGRSGRQRSR